MVEKLGGSEFLGSVEDDNGAVIMGDGCTNFNGLSVVTLGIFLFVFLDEEITFGVFMASRDGEKDCRNCV